MILSFRHNFVFVAVPRTGTHAVRRCLRPLLGPHDWEQCALHEKHEFPIDAFARQGHGHIAATEIQPFLLPGMWRDMFSFGFVRDPLDRFVSACFFLNRENREWLAHPLAGMKRMAESARAKGGCLLASQHTFLCDANGDQMVDFIGRYERIDTDFAAISARIGPAKRGLMRFNTSPRPNGLTHIDDELRERVADLYRDDYLMFGYRNENHKRLAAAARLR